MTMRADLEKLKLIIRPSTEAQARASMEQFEATAPIKGNLVHGLESDLREEYLTCALQVVQDKTNAQIAPRRVMHA